MEIQHILPGFSPKLSSAPSFPISKQLFSLKFPLLSSSYPSIQSQNFEVLSGAVYPMSISQKDICSSSRRRVSCSSNTADPNKGNEVRAQVTGRRKKLAMFVYGGGTNFRSIHEASKRGSLHGDVVILVTNKIGNDPSNYRFTSIFVLLFNNISFYDFSMIIELSYILIVIGLLSLGLMLERSI
uniref:Phosphoribosylglycinamide formyltransferase, chloroplastic-like n=1 Tax=Cicer arietinum TaxID=3827 RepID=A0A3Q7YBA2_CICAR|nr:phosphoribosylglycinamide formyltransferase, chloroplastic-like [Cicer arietinum]